MVILGEEGKHENLVSQLVHLMKECWVSFLESWSLIQTDVLPGNIITHFPLNYFCFPNVHLSHTGPECYTIYYLCSAVKDWRNEERRVCPFRFILNSANKFHVLAQ